MINVRRAEERMHDRSADQERWLTFDPGDCAALLAYGSGAVEILSEVRLAPGAGVSGNEYRDVETLTYVHAGVLAFDDSRGHTRLVHAGEFQLVMCGAGFRHGKRNASRRHWAHFFQVRFGRSPTAVEATQVEKRFSVADRRGGLCVVASLDARGGSLRIGQDAIVYSALLAAGQHVVHELSERRSAWLHVVQGRVALGDFSLSAGDGAGVTAERAVSFTAGDESEVLLVNLGERTPEPFAPSSPSPPRQGPQTSP